MWRVDKPPCCLRVSIYSVALMSRLLNLLLSKKMNCLLHGLLFSPWLAERSADAVNEKMHSRNKTERITTCWPRLEIYKQFLKKQQDFLFPWHQSQLYPWKVSKRNEAVYSQSCSLFSPLSPSSTPGSVDLDITLNCKHCVLIYRIIWH